MVGADVLNAITEIVPDQITTLGGAFVAKAGEVIEQMPTVIQSVAEFGSGLIQVAGLNLNNDLTQFAYETIDKCMDTPIPTKIGLLILFLSFTALQITPGEGEGNQEEE